MKQVWAILLVVFIVILYSLVLFAKGYKVGKEEVYQEAQKMKCLYYVKEYYPSDLAAGNLDNYKLIRVWGSYDKKEIEEDENQSSPIWHTINKGLGEGQSQFDILKEDSNGID